MDVNDLLKFVVDEALVMVPVLMIIAYTIKHTYVIADKWIPVSLLVVSVTFTPILLGGYTASNIVQAVLVTGAAILTNQLYKQYNKKE